MIKIIKPLGFCYGVQNSISKVKELHKQQPERQIVFFKPVVHNHQTQELLEKETGGTIYDPSADYKGYANAFFVSSAHGITRDQKQLAHFLQADLLDCTCPFLSASKGMMEHYLNEGYQVCFLGKSGHDETVSVLNSVPGLLFIPAEKAASFDFNRFKEGEKVALFPQSTLSMTLFNDFKDKLADAVGDSLKVFPLCHECTNRWNEGLSLSPDTPFTFLVIGDKTSSNANEFVNLMKKNFPDKPVYLVTDLPFLESILPKIDFHHDVYVASATSTSPSEAETIIKRLKKASHRALLHPLKTQKK